MSLTLVQGQSDSTFSNFFSLETAKPTEAKFQVVLSLDGEMNICSNGPSHMTNMATMPIYGKNLKNLFWNQTANDLESLYAALGTQVLASIIK